MHKWILPTLSEVLAESELTLTNCLTQKANHAGEINTSLVGSTVETALKRVKAQSEWSGAIAALQQLLLQTIEPEQAFNSTNTLNCQGLVLAAPAPVLSHKALCSSLQTWIFTPSLYSTAGKPFQLPPPTHPAQVPSTTQLVANAGLVLPLLHDDPLVNEQFCLVLTAKFSLVMVLGEDNSGATGFQFTFDPQIVEQAWRSLRERLLLTNSHFAVSQLDALIEKYHPVAPDYRIVTQFSRLLLKHLPPLPTEAIEKEPTLNTLQPRYALPQKHSTSRPDVELLQAFAHEVRTPLTTIRTLTRLILKRRDLTTQVKKHLEIIDHECTEQINRMELLFKAAELETSASKHTMIHHLTPMSLAQVLQQSVPRWQKQASRRNLTLDVILPQQLPTVVSDPNMLDQVLTGLIETFTRSLPAGSHIQVQVIPAGDQLKLQLLPQSQLSENNDSAELPLTLKSLGQLLMFQPETGNISLNLTATKQLFQAIGGKLIVRQRPHQGEILTIFLPINVSPTEAASP